MASWNPLALKILLWLFGVLLVVSSAATFIGEKVFETNTGIAGGTNGPVAGIAFGAGVMIAGFDPEKNVSWVRALILYAILQVVWQIFNQITLARFDIIAFLVAIIVAVLLLVLYPNKSELLMNAGAGSGSGSGAMAGGKARA